MEPPASILASVVAFLDPARVQHHAIIRELLLPLQRIIDAAGVMEICINQPGTAFIETPAGWESAPVNLDHHQLMRLAVAIATATNQRIDAQHPLLSATLPDGERVQFVLPPAAPTISMTLRKPAAIVQPLTWFKDQGMFDETRTAQGGFGAADQALAAHLSAGRIDAFLTAAVIAKKNIVISGATGSGKTTLAKALALSIPSSERLITIEDVAELSLPNHPNHVRLFYSKGGQGSAAVTAQDLLECSLRMKPDRILLSELRGPECFTYLRNAASGHPGSITTCHAGTPMLALEQLSLMVRQSEGGASLDRADIKSLLVQLIDIIVQVCVLNGRRRVTEIYFDPARKHGTGIAKPEVA